MAEPEDPQRQEEAGKAEKPKAAEPDSPRDREELEDLDVDDDTEITERVRGGRRRISIP